MAEKRRVTSGAAPGILSIQLPVPSAKRMQLPRMEDIFHFLTLSLSHSLTFLPSHSLLDRHGFELWVLGFELKEATMRLARRG
jgi:hypothetical protein